MPNITKIELTQINAALASENAALRARVSQLENDVMNVTSVASAINTSSTGAQSATDEAWRAFIAAKKAKMELAKAAALQSGRCVRVQS
jgi:N-acetyl-beta-hexosaminidase